MLIELPGIDKRGGESWGFGTSVYVDPAHVIAIESKEHSYHTFRPTQTYCVIHLSTGLTVETFREAARVLAEVDAAKRAAKGAEPELLAACEAAMGFLDCASRSTDWCGCEECREVTRVISPDVGGQLVTSGK